MTTLLISLMLVLNVVLIGVITQSPAAVISMVVLSGLTIYYLLRGKSETTE
ncbi:hypothetical protein [Alkalicoccus luteus]|uniref:Uncharacterized protein n=1 Tax=Alkalicoccus luteus TaxID=1237094 RepID=A0A969PUE6_9BACI|nr:hypothetical protein [Alkalicoccus luteus]NJP39314.1 hypothetical protein [Alkalicoccus luteus]